MKPSKYKSTYLTLLLFNFLFAQQLFAQGNNFIVISGKIIDEGTKESLSVDILAATLGVPLGNAIGPTELDIASVKITPCAASALYGMNAINEMSNLITKNRSYIRD